MLSGTAPKIIEKRKAEDPNALPGNKNNH